MRFVVNQLSTAHPTELIDQEDRKFVVSYGVISDAKRAPCSGRDARAMTFWPSLQNGKRSDETVALLFAAFIHSSFARQAPIRRFSFHGLTLVLLKDEQGTLTDGTLS